MKVQWIEVDNDSYSVEGDNIVRIEECVRCGRTCWDVIYKSGDMLRLFKVDTVSYVKESTDGTKTDV